MKTLEQRLWEKVDIKDWNDCWPWKAGQFESGYGLFGLKGNAYRAHRLAYKLSYDDFNPELDVLHTCDNPLCCNPGHLFQGTAHDNVQDAISKGRLGISLEVREKILNCKETGLTLRQTALLFGVSKSTVHNVWRAASYAQ